MADKLSRRDFLKLSGLGLSALAFNPPNPADVLKKAEKETSFSINVVSYEGHPVYPHPINFSNRIDFPESENMPSELLDDDDIRNITNTKERKGRTSNQLTALSGEGKNPYDVNPVAIEPLFPIIKDIESEKREFNELVIDAATVPALAMIGSGLVKAGSDKGSKELNVAGGLALATGLFKAVTGALAKPILPQDKDYYEKFAGVIGQYYPIFPQLSSIRGVIVMKDVWMNLDARYHVKPVLALSSSYIDGLESYSEKDPEHLKEMLIYDSKFDATLIKTAIKAGSLDKIFSYKVTDNETNEEVDQELSDWKFLRKLNQKLGFRMPPAPFPGSKMI